MSCEMTATLVQAAPPLEDDNLLAEILLRLPPMPSSLPRASAVSKRWRSLASDPRFSRRFRAHHRRNPPLLGYFVNDESRDIYFQPGLDAPNRVPEGRFTFPIDHGDRFMPLGCRHGLVLSFNSRNRLMVWDPVIGDQHILDIPPRFGKSISAAVLRAAGDVRYFEVVLVGINNMQQVFASVYSSKTGIWGNITTTSLRPGNFVDSPTWVETDIPPVMVGDSLYWLVVGNSYGILEFDLGTRTPSMILMPEEADAEIRDMLFVMADGGGLGFLVLSGYNVQIWKRNTNCDGVASWILGRSIALDKVLPVINPEKSETPYIHGFAEDSNSVLLWTSIGTFTVQLESLQFKKLFQSNSWDKFLPFEAVYTADKCIGDGHDGADLLQNA